MLLFTQLGFFFLIKKLWCENSISLDTDWLPRKSAKALMWFTNNPLSRIEYNIIGEIYEFIIEKPMMRVAYYFMKIDTIVVDGTINGIGRIVMLCSQKMQKVQSGQIQHYAMIMLTGVIILIIIGVVLP